MTMMMTGKMAMTMMDLNKDGWLCGYTGRPDRSPPAQVSAAACFELRASRRCKHACDAEKMLKLILMMMGWGKPVVGVFHGFPKNLTIQHLFAQYGCRLIIHVPMHILYLWTICQYFIIHITARSNIQCSECYRIPLWCVVWNWVAFLWLRDWSWCKWNLPEVISMEKPAASC